MAPAIVAATALVALAVWAVIRLPPLHPVQLWALPWAAMTTLYALHLLPYRPIGPGTAALVVGAAGAFVGGSLLGERVRLPSTVASHSRRLRTGWLAALGGDTDRAVGRAAHLAVGLTAVMLAAFLIELVASFGVRATVITSPEVRRGIAAGATLITIKYVYLAFAAAALSGLAASRTRGGARGAHLTGAAFGVAATYFSTGRGNVVIAALIACVAYSLGRDRTLSRGRFVLGGAALAVLTLTVFIAGGELIGKTYANSPLSRLDHVFSRHEAIAPLGLPYLYASAPIAALERQVHLVGPLGRARGCANLSAACSILRAAGVDVEPEPRTRPFTGAPIAWNTYTALDLPLIDGGLVLAVPIVGLQGILVGVFWGLARRRRAVGVVSYALFSSAVVFSFAQNNFTAPSVLGAVAFSLVALALTLSTLDRRGQPVMV